MSNEADENTEVNGVKSIDDNTFIDKYGFNITYDTEEDRFTLSQVKYTYLNVDTKEEISSWSEIKDDEKFLLSQLNVDRKLVDSYNYDYGMLNEVLFALRYEIYPMNQNSTDIRVNINQQDFVDYVDGSKGYYKKGAININVINRNEINKKWYEDMVNDYNSFTNLQSTYEHEMTHAMDERYHGLRQYDLPPQYMAKLDMMSEIRANLTEAGLALDMYKATGNMDYFNQIVAIDMTEVKDKLKQNPNMENPEGYIADYVIKNWLETNNQTGGFYSEQAKGSGFSFAMYALDGTDDSLKRYHERADAMFEHIEGLGDVRKYVNPDFELNDELKASIEEANNLDISDDLKFPRARNPNLKAMMMHNANNAEAYSKNLMAYLELVKQVDADGYRTTAENELLDKYMQEHMAPQNESSDYVAKTYQPLTNDSDGVVITDSSSTKNLKALIRAGVNNVENYHQSLQSYMELSQLLDASGVSAEEKKAQLKAYVDTHIMPNRNDIATQIETQNADVAKAGDNTAQTDATMIMKMADKGNVK